MMRTVKGTNAVCSNKLNKLKKDKESKAISLIKIRDEIN